MFKHVENVFKKYATFTGRAQRAEYWYFILFNIVIAFILGMISNAIKDQSGVLTSIYSLVVLIPGLAVSVRRLHDIGKNSWTLLLSLIPLIGQIWLLVYMTMDSTPGNNKYGPNPKGVNPSTPQTQQ